MEGRTTLIVAHRLSTLRARRIVWSSSTRVRSSSRERTTSSLPKAGCTRSCTACKEVRRRTEPCRRCPAPEPLRLDATGTAVVRARTSRPGQPMTENGRRPKVVVLGMMSKIPVAGVVWQTLHYLIGFERLGLDAYYVEAHARTPSMLMTSENDDSAALAADFIGAVMARHGLGDRWAFQALHSDARCYGLSAGELGRLYRDAELILNLSRRDAAPSGARGERAARVPRNRSRCSRRSRCSTNFRRPSTSSTSTARTSRSPRTTARRRARCRARVATSFARRANRSCSTGGKVSGHPSTGASRPLPTGISPGATSATTAACYGWTKDDEFRRVIDLPAATSVDLELALANCDAVDHAALVKHGWRVRSAARALRDIDTYRRYIRALARRVQRRQGAERRLSHRLVLRPQRHVSRRGRPVVMQDTGFGETLPTGRGSSRSDSRRGRGCARSCARRLRPPCDRCPRGSPFPLQPRRRSGRDARGDRRARPRAAYPSHPVPCASRRPRRHTGLEASAVPRPRTRSTSSTGAGGRGSSSHRGLHSSDGTAPPVPT